MNIEILHDHINAFKREIIDSGFKRDIDDYTNSLASVQSNIVSLRDIASKVLLTLERLYNGDLPTRLSALLPGNNIRPFTETPHARNFKALVDNTTIQQAEFFNQLTLNLNELKKQLNQNFTEISKIEGFISPYLSQESKVRSEKGFATLSIVFKEESTIYSLSKFSETLAAWNRDLPIYYQLLKSDSPKDIQLAEVQNGSIDVVININYDVALNLVELFKVGFHCYVAYLTYKNLMKPIVATFLGNTKLIQGEEEREKDLIDNIGKAIENAIYEQHDRARKEDKEINETSVKKKVEVITELVTQHIIKGNDIKLLATPTIPKKDGKEDTLVRELIMYSEEVRSKLRLLPQADRKLLIDKYDASPQEKKETKKNE